MPNLLGFSKAISEIATSFRARERLQDTVVEMMSNLSHATSEFSGSRPKQWCQPQSTHRSSQQTGEELGRDASQRAGKRNRSLVVALQRNRLFYDFGFSQISNCLHNQVVGCFLSSNHPVAVRLSFHDRRSEKPECDASFRLSLLKPIGRQTWPTHRSE